jgi:stage III sporulation protein SpoIIIAA
VRAVLESHARLYELLEVVMDLGRPPMARSPGHDVAKHVHSQHYKISTLLLLLLLLL